MSVILFLYLSTLLVGVMSKTQGEQLADLINNYRRSKGLSKIPYSKTLMKVGKLHCDNMCATSNWNCESLHAWKYWSGKPSKLVTCCNNYKGNNGCMWKKPKEVGGLDSAGYEISARGQKDLAAALNGWKKSSGHNTVMINQGMWKNMNWQGIGCGATTSKKIYHCWFSTKRETGYSSVGDPCGGGGSVSNPSSGGTCCSCSSNPSKTKCDYKCRQAVGQRDSWCNKNGWDGQCKNVAKKLCSGLNMCDGEESFCIGSSLWTDDEAKQFVLDDDSNCANSQPMYVESDGIYSVRYVLEDDRNGTAFKEWVMTKDEDITVIATCDKEDITECTASQWKVLISDELGPINEDYVEPALTMEVRQCPSPQKKVNDEEMQAQKTVTMVVVILAIVLIIGVLFYSCVYQKGKLRKKGEKISIREDDDLEQKHTAEAMETIDVDEEDEEEEIEVDAAIITN